MYHIIVILRLGIIAKLVALKNGVAECVASEVNEVIEHPHNPAYLPPVNKHGLLLEMIRLKRNYDHFGMGYEKRTGLFLICTLQWSRLYFKF